MTPNTELSEIVKEIFQALEAKDNSKVLELIDQARTLNTELAVAE
jgi:hypothetical protein